MSVILSKWCIDGIVIYHVQYNLYNPLGQYNYRITLIYAENGIPNTEVLQLRWDDGNGSR